MQLTRSLPADVRPVSLLEPTASKDLYFALLEEPKQDAVRHRAADYLRDQLEVAADLPCDLPADPAGLGDWLGGHTERIGRQYQAYLDSRRAGAPRRYFSSKAHALHFLRGVAPTKLVDGAWLYGLLQRWDEPRFQALIQTYLEELGEGLPEKNHVVLYRKLLASQGCGDWQDLNDEHFVQGAIQLALAECAEQFLPEVIGFNLGYEQLPLHLLITAYELTELGIDPYYFTLHVTVDNADNGHARKAVQSLQAAWPQVGDSAEFYRRVGNGYRLNELGASTLSVIEGFDIDREVRRILEKKAAVGQFVHSDYCRFEGRTVNQWLAAPTLIEQFLDIMQRRGWIKRGQDPQASRFWQLITGEQAPMFGVFSSHEQQLIHDWIAGDWLAEQSPKAAKPPLRPAQGQRDDRHPQQRRADNDFDQEAQLLEQQLARLPSREARMRHLLPLLAPIRHHSHAGLLATRLFTGLFN
ncbi:iron-containing redox enzyme family protein [Stutzerimonas nitrititolerans]|uniref:iron-containing redox enzyme family protein n=1 Tax=Stutzerimonas nitrititolerans TaxID=2482751 RepID=UPI0015E299BB|nr:iron-containing redox enzyme family protein [Stutzerimonas nitrititolerans]MBA1185606.1 iron-containing redox enzyme family protein [Stutzerimonas stutzeri]